MKLLVPVVKKTKLLETDGCSVAMVYQTVVDLLDNLQYCNPEDLVAVQVRSLIEDQKFDTMRIAFLLDPATNPDAFLGDDLMKALYDIPVVAKRLGYSEDVQKAVFREANIFVNVKWDWSPEQQANAATCPPVEWWGHKRDLYPALFEFARKVFTIPTSSAAAEVSRSTHKYFHSTLFVNGIKPEAMRKLGFIFSSRKSNVVEVPEVH